MPEDMALLSSVSSWSESAALGEADIMPEPEGIMEGAAEVEPSEKEAVPCIEEQHVSVTKKKVAQKRHIEK